jgi:uncharacterized membrane protein YadS
MRMNKEYIRDALRQLIKIFIRYFVIFFIALVALASLAWIPTEADSSNGAILRSD